MTEDTHLKPGRFVESDNPQVVAFAQEAVCGESDPIVRSVRLYNCVRDQIIYDPYQDLAQPEVYSAKYALGQGRGFCISKAALLVACARALGIPARLGFADVRNHLASTRLIEANNGDIFRWHAYAELHLLDKWVKATPAFDADLCRRCGIEPLEFSGLTDSIFHQFDRHHRKHMEYLLDRGSFNDVPFEQILATMETYSPGLLRHDFHSEARSFATEAKVNALREHTGDERY